jgi:hypothetical protein
MWAKKSKSVNGNGQKYNNRVVKASDGTSCDSELEKRMYELLKKFKIPFEFQKRIIVQEGFRTRDDEAIRPISCIVDFWLDNGDGTITIIDTKGFFTEESKIKFKLLRFHFHKNSVLYKLYMPRISSEVDSLAIKIKHAKEKA